MRQYWKPILVLLVLGGSLTGWAVWQNVAHSREAVHFRTAAVEKADLVATISATGTIEPEEVIDVGAQVAAQIKNFGADPRDPKRAIDYGSPVRAGTLLAQLDDALFKARLAQSQAAVDEAHAQVAQAEANVQKAEADRQQLQAKYQQAQRDWARAQTLRPQRAISDTDYDAAQAAFETAQANVHVGDAAIALARAAQVQVEKSLSRAKATLQEAEVNLGYTQIRSPVEGVIVDRRVNVGQTVVAGLNAPSLFLIAKDLTRLQVWASVNEADIGNIHPGQVVRFTVDAYPKEVFTGQVAQIRLNASMTQNVVTYTVVVSTDNAQGKLLPYMTASLQFQIDVRHDALLVPNAAFRWRPQPSQVAADSPGQLAAGPSETRDQAVLWLADGSFVRPVTVEVGLSDGSRTEIRSADLPPGRRVVIGTSGSRAAATTTNPFAPKMYGGKSA